MQLNLRMPTAMLVLGGLVAVGCHKSGDTAGGSMPTTMAAAPTTMPAMAAAPTLTPPPTKDLTHVLTKDEPYFASEPTAGATPTGTLKEGSKVLVLIPGADYSQVITDTGVSAYTSTDGLKPLGK